MTKWDDLDAAAERAIAENIREWSHEQVADYLDLLVKRGYLRKKGDKHAPKEKFGLAWADATLVVIMKVFPKAPQGDVRGEVALEMVKAILRLDDANIADGKNVEELVRLAKTVLGFARNYFPDSSYIAKILDPTYKI